MAVDKVRASVHLRAFDFPVLFIEELGWDRPESRQAEIIEVEGALFSLAPVAQKRHVRIFHCDTVPERNIRQRIERELTKRAYEHLIIFTDSARTRQLWQWVARGKGKPAALREHTWLASSAPDALIQKLYHIAFTLNEEANLTLAGTIVRMRDAFDREQITRRFYGEFEVQHQAFLGFIKGLEAATDRQWYASLMLNRLMFIYFIQRKGFLDSDPNYLRERLRRVRAEQGAGRFHSFYRAFLLTLFHGGLAMPVNQRDPATARLLGAIPYLNGGLFEPHILEDDDSKIEISDEAFEAVFDFFDRYDWTLDTRPISRNDGREINPDVLGHIFEKYINNKQMGAYYTKEDITDYITRNTVIPWLFQNAAKLDKVAFDPCSAVWRMLSENPDEYIYPSVKRGADLPLPPHIEEGIDDAAQRVDWNKTADPGYGLPSELWREVIARRERYQAIRTKATKGEISTVEDLITYNLDIRQLARDVIQYAESPDVVKAFWDSIKAIKILDPACGSGAFLFAALNILYDLYDACLDRMEKFVSSAPEPVRPGAHPPFKGFRDELSRISEHQGRDYFIFKEIILNNLYGVDIMEEAVEICKLRLFLKLAAQLERLDQIEPLPDIDFNIRSGNTLIGYTSFADVRRASEVGGFDFEDRAGKIEKAAEDLDALFKLFREQQTTLHGAIEADHKVELRRRLAEQGRQLDRFLAGDYGIAVGDDPGAVDRFAAWKVGHRPFHWLIEFFGIIKSGGFDVVIGNPPYVKASEVRQQYSVRGYATERCSDIYAWIMERATALTSPNGLFGMIVPLSLTFSGSFQPLRDFLLRQFSSNWFSSFARIPAALFSSDVRVRNTIHIGRRSGRPGQYSTIIHRWFEEARPYLLERVEYGEFEPRRWDGLIPKFGNGRLLARLEAVKQASANLDSKLSTSPTSHVLHFKQAAYNWVSFSFEEPPARSVSGERVPQTKVGRIYTSDSDTRLLIHTLLNGKIAFLWWCIVGDDFDVTRKDFEFLPYPTQIRDEAAEDLRRLSTALDQAMNENVVYKLNAGKLVGNYNLARCRAVTDESDLIWAHLLGLAGCMEEIELAYVQIVKTSFAETDTGTDA